MRRLVHLRILIPLYRDLQKVHAVVTCVHCKGNHIDDSKIDCNGFKYVD